MQAIFVAFAQADAGIPFKTSTVVPAGSLAWAVLCTFLVLAGIVAGLLLAKRRGWLRPWIGASPIAPKEMDGTLRITGRIKMSATSRAYVIESDGVSYLVIESSQHVAVHRKESLQDRRNAREA